MVIHRALLGSLERFFGVYLEHVAGAFPFWLAPEQIVFVPVNNEIHGEYCTKIADRLKEQGFRVRVDLSNETMGKKTRTLQKAKVPFMAVIGDKEVEANTLALRKYGSKETNVHSLDEALTMFSELANERFPKKLEAN